MSNRPIVLEHIPLSHEGEYVVYNDVFLTKGGVFQ